MINFRRTWIVFMVAATSAPYLMNFLSCPAGHQYTWILPPYPEDSLAYMAWSQQAFHGNLLFKIKYTILPHAPFLFHPLFLLFGNLGAWTGWDLGIVHLVMKSVGVVFFYLALFKYLDHFKLAPLESIVTTVLISLSSGFGWLAQRLLGTGMSSWYVPADLWVVDINTFWSLLWNPIFPYSLALLVMSMLLLDRGSKENQPRDLWLAGLATGLFSFIHPYSTVLVVLYGSLLIVARLKREATGPLLRFFAFSLPLALTVFLISKLNPIAARHGMTGSMNTLSPVSYGLGLGVPFLLCLSGLFLKRNLLIKFAPVVLWILLSLGMSYLPLWFQRKLIFGIHLPVCLLAAVVLGKWIGRVSDERKRRLVLILASVTLLPLSMSTPFHLLHRQAQEVQSKSDGAYYLPNELAEGMAYLRARTDPNDIVFASIETSRLIPAFAGNTVFWGHWAMSVDFAERTEWLKDIVSRAGHETDGELSAEFRKSGVAYLLVDDSFRRLFFSKKPAWMFVGARKVFENRSLAIYAYE